MSNRPTAIRPLESPRGRQEPPVIKPAALVEAIGRRTGTILLLGLLTALAVGIAGLFMPRSYTSTSQLLLDPRGLRVLEKDISPQAREADQSISVIESEMRFLASDLVLNRVVERLGLARDGALTGEPAKGDAVTAPGWAAPIIGALDTVKGSLKAMLGRTDNGRASPEQAALIALQKAVKVSRQPSTYVLDIAVTVKDRELAPRIANAIASEYIVARFSSRTDASRKALESINGRLEELARKVNDDDNAVERHKAANDLVTNSGRLLTESRMGELSTQLQMARAETVRAQARMDQVRALRASGGAGDMSMEALQSPTLERLRVSQALVRQREAALSAQLLPSHPLIKQVRQESAAVQRSVDQELARIAETAGTALERAKSTERALDSQLGEMKSRVLGESKAMVELRELERVAEATRSIYQTFLVRARELSEQQRIDPSSAVVLAQAEPARAPNGPGLLPLAAAAGFAGLGLGAALALRRDRRDPAIRSLMQLEEIAGDDPVHDLVIPAPRGLGGWLRERTGRSSDAEYLAAPERSATAEAAARLYRAVSTGGRRRSGPLVCLVTAAEPYQGKSTVALNLALAAARTGESVLIIDGDRDLPTASLAAGANERTGLAEVVDGTVPATAAIMRRSEPPVDLLPAGKLKDLRPTRAKLDRLSETLLTPLAAYDLVVIDGSIAGRDRLTQALVARADATLVAVQAGSGAKDAVGEAARWLSGAAGAPVHLVLVRSA